MPAFHQRPAYPLPLEPCSNGKRRERHSRHIPHMYATEHNMPRDSAIHNRHEREVPDIFIRVAYAVNQIMFVAVAMLRSGKSIPHQAANLRIICRLLPSDKNIGLRHTAKIQNSYASPDILNPVKDKLTN